MKISERIAQLNTQREAKIGQLKTIHEKAMEEGRTFDDTEQSGFDTVKGEIESIDKQLESCASMEKMLATTATPAATPAANGGVDVPGSRLTVVRNLPKGAAFTRYAMSLAAAKGNTVAAAEMAKSMWKDTPEVETVLRAAVAAGTTTDPNWAKPLAQYTDMASEFIELLRPATIWGQMTGFKAVPFNVRMPRQLTGATAQWVGEGAPKPVSAMSFDSFIIPHTKVAVIVAITEELARLSTPSAQATVQQDLVNTIAQFLDVNMIDPGIAPIAGVSPGSLGNPLTINSTYINSTGGTVAQVTNDLNAAMTAQAVASIPARNPYWILHPRTKNYIMSLRTSQDIFAFKDEMVTGKLMGIPFIVSANVPLRDFSSPPSPGTLETVITLIEASEVFLADDGEVTLDVSREASLQMDSAPSAGASTMFSMWQNNMIAIRAERWIYWAARRPQAVFQIRQVPY